MDSAKERKAERGRDLMYAMLQPEAPPGPLVVCAAMLVSSLLSGYSPSPSSCAATSPPPLKFFRRLLRPPRPRPQPLQVLKLPPPPKIQAIQILIRPSTVHQDAALAQLEKAAIAQQQRALPPAVRRLVESFAGVCRQNVCTDHERQEPLEWIQARDLKEGSVLLYRCEA